MPLDPLLHLVFVDFENVPSVDLDAIGALSVQVTLLIGKNQTRLDTALVGQIHRHAAKVRLIEAGASGRNALDLILAHYLGRANAEAPHAELHIVSKDRDFDPLISHLRNKDVQVSRSESFAALPFLPTKKSAAPSPHRKTAPAPKKPAPADPSALLAGKREKLISRLKNNLGPRPKRKKSLLHHISTAYGNRLTDKELADLVDQLVASGVLKIDPDDKVTY